MRLKIEKTETERRYQMPNALKREDALFQNLHFLPILRRGGQWPDWNGPFGQMTLRLAISELASSIADEKLRVHIKKLANQNISQLAVAAHM